MNKSFMELNHDFTHAFGQFLIDNSALEQFIANYDSKFYLKGTDIPDPHYYIVRSFDWDETKEGSKFWNDLSHKWMDIIDKDRTKNKTTKYVLTTLDAKTYVGMSSESFQEIFAIATSVSLRIDQIRIFELGEEVELVTQLKRKG